MAHARQDTLVASPQWWKHLKPFNKRLVAKKERRAAKKQVEVERGHHNMGED